MFDIGYYVVRTTFFYGLLVAADKPALSAWYYYVFFNWKNYQLIEVSV